MTQRFAKRTVLVTGASLGVGRACAEQFHREGAQVVLVARRAGPLAEVAAALGDRVLVAPADVSDLDAMRDVLQEVVATFGGLHGLVNNAGVHHRGAVLERTPEELAQIVDVNLRAPIALTRLALPHLLEGGGFVVNVASLAGKLALEGAATYSSTKFGLRAFSRALAEELRGTGVTVSAVNPGPIDTGFIMSDIDEVSDLTLSQPVCSAAHVAEMVVACALDGRAERDWPASAGRLATLAYIYPAVRRWLKPTLERRGRRRKERLKRAQHGEPT